MLARTQVRASLAAAAILAALALPPWRRILVLARTLRRDLVHLLTLRRALRIVRSLTRPGNNVAVALEERARDTPDKVVFLFEDERWTCKDINEYANRVAHVLSDAGVAKGDVVALVLGNRIEYICVWLGAAKLGAVTALVNRNLVDLPLSHSIRTARPKAVLFGREYTDAVDAVRKDLGEVRAFLQFDHDEQSEERPWFRNVVPLLGAASAENPVVSSPPGFHDPFVYVYTSGTTGLPKAAVITHGRFLFWPVAFLLLSGLEPGKDVVFSPLPLYHAAAGGYISSLAILYGVTVAYCPKFSARKYWSDCIKHGATVAQYIGELCRFLVLAPESAEERKHSVRVMFGNGLSTAVWPRALERFGVDKIMELYGSTEGNIMLLNYVGKVGAVGFMPRCLPRSWWPVDFVRVDEETNEPIRDKATGWCIRCKEGEPGMLIGRVRDNMAHTWFAAYVDHVATEKKTLRDVFAIGDKYFMSGDILEMDELGYIYFKDRMGETFRWKGENVSTTEIETVVSQILLPQGVGAVAVYGVQVPEQEGRAGMAAIADPGERVNLRVLAEQLSKRLPSYARPVFVRVADALPTTATHKVSKVVLQRQGYDEAADGSKVYVYDSRTANYEPLTDGLLDDIRENRLRI